ncbi:DUF2634 domain-containing protein [Aneurinibacillus thermoaerophilus]|uniref:DUF2634 domain-containing protein n=1 Tax=Aneurinibacillus thermoaerophilus TaxID=143495 RepID=UPI002E23D1AA|nr:DUF2634 domain-containing protein [Aneurinibacillus thermoaerophilus]
MIPEMPNSDDFLQEVEQEQLDIDLGVTFLFDYEKGDFVLENGSPVEVTDIEAVKAWITKMLKTEQGKYEAYESELYAENPDYRYGTKIREIAIQHIATDYKKAEIKRELEEKVTRHPRISFLSDFRFEQEDECMTIYFRVNLIDGDSFEYEGVI